MKEIKEHIRTDNYKPVYLLYGTETYLRRLYTSKLKKGALGSGDSMNLSVYSGKNIDWNEVRSLAETMPFFSEHRILVFEDSGAFKQTCDFADAIPSLPSSTILIFNETEVDKRNRMYKVAKEHGYVSEMNGLSENDLCLFTASLIQKNQKKITRDDLLYLLSRIGSDMDNIESEVEKLICYSGTETVITREAIDAISSGQVTGKIFALTDAVGMKNKNLALSLYHDLIEVREKPLMILSLVIRQCNILLQTSEMNRQGLDKAAIAAKAGIPPFVVSKSISQARNFTTERLVSLISSGTELEEKVKNGQLPENIAIEIFLLNAIQ